MTSDEYGELNRSLDEHREDTKTNFAAVRGEMHQHFTMLTEDLGGRIRLVAEGHAALRFEGHADQAPVISL